MKFVKAFIWKDSWSQIWFTRVSYIRRTGCPSTERDISSSSERSNLKGWGVGGKEEERRLVRENWREAGRRGGEGVEGERS